jgi:uncharacterized protein YbjT (DUF2867 family)
VLDEGGRRLLEAERRAGVGHHLAASIVGIDDVPLGYSRVKVEQEQVVREGGVPFTIVRATQLHSMLAALFCAASARARVLPVGPARLQTVDAAEVAGLLADIAEAAPRDGVVTIAGPETRTLTDIARTYRASSERRRALLVPVVPPGRLGRKLRAGALTDPRPYRRGTTTFAQWLARR